MKVKTRRPLLPSGDGTWDSTSTPSLILQYTGSRHEHGYSTEVFKDLVRKSGGGGVLPLSRVGVSLWKTPHFRWTLHTPYNSRVVLGSN